MNEQDKMRELCLGQAEKDEALALRLEEEAGRIAAMNRAQRRAEGLTAATAASERAWLVEGAAKARGCASRWRAWAQGTRSPS